MGLKIELPVYTIEEAALLTDTLIVSREYHKAAMKMRHATPEEVRTHERKADLLEVMLGRLSGEGDTK